MKTMLIPAELDRLDDVIDAVTSELEEADCPMKAVLQVQLSVEEIYVNIAHYAYSPNTGDIEIIIAADSEKREFTITFKDSGIPFDPLAKADADTTLSAEERGIGGLGIFLVKKNMSKVSYVYEGSQNCLTLVKDW